MERRPRPVRQRPYASLRIMVRLRELPGLQPDAILRMGDRERCHGVPRTADRRRRQLPHVSDSALRQQLVVLPRRPLARVSHASGASPVLARWLALHQGRRRDRVNKDGHPLHGDGQWTTGHVRHRVHGAVRLPDQGRRHDVLIVPDYYAVEGTNAYNVGYMYDAIGQFRYGGGGFGGC